MMTLQLMQTKVSKPFLNTNLNYHIIEQNMIVFILLTIFQMIQAMNIIIMKKNKKVKKIVIKKKSDGYE